MRGTTKGDLNQRQRSVLRQVALYGTGCGGLAFGAERLTIGAHPIHRLRTPQTARLEARQQLHRFDVFGGYAGGLIQMTEQL